MPAVFSTDGSRNRGNVYAYGRDGLAIVPGKFKYAANYVAGGEAINLTARLRRVDLVLLQPTGGYQFVYDPATKTIKAYTMAGAEVGGGTNLTALEIPFVAFGL